MFANEIQYSIVAKFNVIPELYVNELNARRELPLMQDVTFYYVFLVFLVTSVSALAHSSITSGKYRGAATSRWIWTSH